MDELEFQRVLHLFPVVRARDYNAESEVQRQLTTQASRRIRERMNSQIEGGVREKVIGGIDGQDAFWEKLKIAAAKKVCYALFILALVYAICQTILYTKKKEEFFGAGSLQELSIPWDRGRNDAM
ncbi:hypothetical protein R6Q57_017120 [Mikania cordata]